MDLEFAQLQQYADGFSITLALLSEKQKHLKHFVEFMRPKRCTAFQQLKALAQKTISTLMTPYLLLKHLNIEVAWEYINRGPLFKIKSQTKITFDLGLTWKYMGFEMLHHSYFLWFRRLLLEQPYLGLVHWNLPQPLMNNQPAPLKILHTSRVKNVQVHHFAEDVIYIGT